MKHGIASGVLAILLALGCSPASGDSSAGCGSVCEDVCSRLRDCSADNALGDCLESCTTGLPSYRCDEDDARPARPGDVVIHVDPGLPPPTCGEIRYVYDCAKHCSALCNRAAECGNFDTSLCLEGCSSQLPYICNEKSVAARTCDQLDPELRLYEAAARARRVGDPFTGSRDPKTFGLCSACDMAGFDENGTYCAYSSAGCAEPTVCSPETNTCGGCTVEEQCHRFANPLHCDAARGSCVECLNDTHCAGRPDKACHPVHAACVGCVRDEHCAPYACDAATNWCSECRADYECTDPQKPHCSFGRCVAWTFPLTLPFRSDP